MSDSLIAFGIPSGPDMFIIAVLVLVLFGAKKLPVFARSLGRSMGEFRKAKEEFEQELHNAASEESLPPPRPRAPETKPAAEEPKQPVATTTTTTQP
jgi:sec-independent protein translocase protein TatA